MPPKIYLPPRPRLASAPSLIPNPIHHIIPERLRLAMLDRERGSAGVICHNTGLNLLYILPDRGGLLSTLTVQW